MQRNKLFDIINHEVKVTMERLIEMFETIADIRDSKRKRHSLVHIMVLAVCAMLNGYNDFEEALDESFQQAVQSIKQRPSHS
jgi:plasmid replication initiation protein